MKQTEAKEVFAQLFPARLRKGDKTKARLLKAAIDQIAKDGVENLTFESVGKRIGMNRAQVKYHFNEKEQLLDKVFEYVVACAQQIIVRNLSSSTKWRRQIDEIVDGFFDWAEVYPEQGSVLLFLYFSSSFSEKRREFQTRMSTMGFHRLLALLEGVRKDRGWNNSQMKTLCYAIWAIIDGMMVYHLTMKHNAAPQYFRKEAMRSISLLLDA